MNTETILLVIIVCQLALIYGLVNRLVRREGLPAMNAVRRIAESLDGVIGTPKEQQEPRRRVPVETYKVNAP